MSKLPTTSVLKLVLEKKSFRFLLGTIVSLSFSMAVILCTIGLMDGFEITLKKALANANGDIKMTSERGFYLFDEFLQKDLKKVKGISNFSPVLQIESFAITDIGSKGVLIKGVEHENFSEITDIDIGNLSEGVVIGVEFAKSHNLKIDDYITLALASSKEKTQGVAILEDFQVKKIIKHGIHEKDMRFIYMNKRELEKLLGYKAGVTNLTYIKIDNFEKINDRIQNLRTKSAEHFNFEPYWSEFEVLLDAVEIEKHSISLILQIIVLVAILNVVAFIIYISEIKAQDFFMLRALGLSVKKLEQFWFIVLTLIWFVSTLFGYVQVVVFDYLIRTVPYLKVPGDIYVLSELKVILDPLDYFYVYGVSFIWVWLVGLIVLKKLNKQSVIAGLRQEFS